MRIGRRELQLTNLDKVFFPKLGATKGDLVRYYFELAPYVLNHVQRRPMHMKRYPHGVEGEFFHQKRVPVPHPEWLETVHIVFPRHGRTADFPVVTDAAGLAWIANLGCIELHTWHSRVDDVERPDYMLIDLDPSEGNPWEHVRVIALVVKEVMDELDVPSYPKTSGATGFHVLVPIRPELRFPDVRRFAKALAEEVERRIGDQDVATTTWKVADRRGVFVDYGQNARDRTIASAYSIRPRADTRVLRAASLGRGGRSRPGGVHAHDDARARGTRRRSHRRHVAAEGQPRPALREARARSAGTVGSPFLGRGRTCANVQSSGFLSGRKRRKRVPWRKRAFCHLS
jgi:bifunctional non-homologous end joining protein LigD